jgi:hypothetical protein
MLLVLVSPGRGPVPAELHEHAEAVADRADLGDQPAGHAHAASEVSTTAVNSAASAGSQDWVAGLDDQEFPLLAAAARSSAGTDDSTRFEFAIAAFIRGVAPTAS